MLVETMPVETIKVIEAEKAWVEWIGKRAFTSEMKEAFESAFVAVYIKAWNEAGFIEDLQSVIEADQLLVLAKEATGISVEIFRAHQDVAPEILGSAVAHVGVICAGLSHLSREQFLVMVSHQYDHVVERTAQLYKEAKECGDIPRDIEREG